MRPISGRRRHREAQRAGRAAKHSQAIQGKEGKREDSHKLKPLSITNRMSLLRVRTLNAEMRGSEPHCLGDFH